MLGLLLLPVLLFMWMQAALAKEKSERARIVLSLRDTITGLKQAGDVEGRLKADLVQTHEHLASSRIAQVSPHAVLCHAMAHMLPAVRYAMLWLTCCLLSLCHAMAHVMPAVHCVMLWLTRCLLCTLMVILQLDCWTKLTHHTEAPTMKL